MARPRGDLLLQTIDDTLDLKPSLREKILTNSHEISPSNVVDLAAAAKSVEVCFATTGLRLSSFWVVVDAYDLWIASSQAYSWKLIEQVRDQTPVLSRMKPRQLSIQTS